ncbi:MAG TPA: hypothetical protein PLJ47_04090 [Candidatus Hydrogenedentes bacterium]|nr:hypothetical protein [Candidatus Hydrogenedentota bacterium]HRK33756.1 hypothetical protein [Candidatus Hydrogenedentota bacterium]
MQLHEALCYDIQMPDSRAARRARLILHMDKDRVGMLSGAFFGLIVLIICVVWTGADALEIVFRVGLTFIVSYVAAFFLVHVFQQVAGPELKPKRNLRLGPPGADEKAQPDATPPGEEQQ